MVLFSAVHMSPIGTSRQFATTQQFGRFRGEADIRRARLRNWIHENAPRLRIPHATSAGYAVRFSRCPPRGMLVERIRPREDVMTHLAISELLMLTCIGTIIASVTYAVKLSIVGL